MQLCVHIRYWMLAQAGFWLRHATHRAMSCRLQAMFFVTAMTLESPSAVAGRCYFTPFWHPILPPLIKCAVVCWHYLGTHIKHKWYTVHDESMATSYTCWDMLVINQMYGMHLEATDLCFARRICITSHLQQTLLLHRLVPWLDSSRWQPHWILSNAAECKINLDTTFRE